MILVDILTVFPRLKETFVQKDLSKQFRVDFVQKNMLIQIQMERAESSTKHALKIGSDRNIKHVSCETSREVIKQKNKTSQNKH